MTWFLNLPTRAKLFLTIGGILALLAIAFATTYRSLAELTAEEARVREQQVTVRDLARLTNNHNEARVAALMILAEPNSPDIPRWREEIRRARQENQGIEEELVRRHANDSYFSQQMREYGVIRGAFVNARETVLRLSEEGRAPEARSISLQANQERYEAMRAIAYDLTQRMDAAASQAAESSRATTVQAKRVLLWTGLGSMVLGVFGVFVLGRMIASPLQELLAAAQRVSRGDLRSSLYLKRRDDEIGVLARAFAGMLENFRTVQAEIQEGVSVLATSASEISTATAEIAASATETATAVSQTTTTVEEVKQTAQVSAQKAGHVADVAQKAVHSAHTGRKAVEDSIEGMKAIREQMEIVADTIVRLSEQSQAISDIIASVNDLAEQSNLLAVNAAIEAAKAGEHGRGFAVVAQEIRSLASQSKEATSQVRTILNDIQKATTAAVMAAEQGSKAVDVGVRQVNQSGETIRALAETIVTAAQAATQITASSQQQLIGVDQVAGAMQNILQASRQNASGTQQAEAGARNLNELGQKLKTLAGRFTV